jgi:methyltransferase of ATP-grasp peptide maturase system
MIEDYKFRQAAMVEGLVKAGTLRSPAWIEAFSTVPRHPFVGRRIYLQDDSGPYTRWRPVDAAVPGWIELVYQDEALITQLDGAEQSETDDEQPVLGSPTSSSSMPTAMALMMEDLQVEDGQKVLEIGTGTGWSTALLCARLGDDAVTSVELDSGLGYAAAKALHDYGVAPTLVIGDGLAGHEPTAPFDRIVSTCSVRAVPRAWLAQSKPGTRIVTPVRGWMEGTGLLELTVDEDGDAQGGFARRGVGFMFARAHTAPALNVLPALSAGRSQPNRIGVELLQNLDDHTGRWILQLALPEAVTHGVIYPGETIPVLHNPLTGSTAWVYPDHVVEVGSENLWARAQAAVEEWRDAGSPSLYEFQVDITSTAQTVSHERLATSFELPAV